MCTSLAMLVIVLLLPSGESLQDRAPAVSALRTMSLDGATITYLDQGQGTPMVFVHGWFSDHRTWEPQREAVASRYRFIAIDQRYFGTAAWPDTGGQFSTTTHVADLAAFIRKVAGGPVYLVGQSYGSRWQPPSSTRTWCAGCFSMSRRRTRC